jgi:hypothetical protein
MKESGENPPLFGGHETPLCKFAFVRYQKPSPFVRNTRPKQVSQREIEIAFREAYGV